MQTLGIKIKNRKSQPASQPASQPVSSSNNWKTETENENNYRSAFPALLSSLSHLQLQEQSRRWEIFHRTAAWGPTTFPSGGSPLSNVDGWSRCLFPFHFFKQLLCFCRTHVHRSSICFAAFKPPPPPPPSPLATHRVRVCGKRDAFVCRLVRLSVQTLPSALVDTTRWVWK